MATNYGMGQYRMQQGTNYISLIGKNIKPKFVEVQTNTYTYKDIYFDLQNIRNNDNNNNNNFNGFQYGDTYYLELKLPQHIQYSSDIDIKICGANSREIDIENQFQNIQQITVPSSLTNANFYKDVLLYLDPTDMTIDPKSKIGIIYPNSSEASNGEIYQKNGEYFLKINNNNNIKIENYQSARITESWKLKDTDNNGIITYKIIFSPKFQIGAGGYPYLYLEIDRNNDWNTNIQYIENGTAYRGLFIDTNKAELNIYKINNLLGKDKIISQSSLNHIGIWGHPEMYLAINGEQIQIGKNGFYELDDFNITNLGVVVTNPNIDRFSIDYEFVISDDDEEGE